MPNWPTDLSFVVAWFGLLNLTLQTTWTKKSEHEDHEMRHAFNASARPGHVAIWLLVDLTDQGRSAYISKDVVREEFDARVAHINALCCRS